MLIRILKQSKDLVEGKAHAPGSEISRRSFLHRTGLGVGSVLITPALVSLLKSNPAEAAAFSCSVESLSTSMYRISSTLLRSRDGSLEGRSLPRYWNRFFKRSRNDAAGDTGSIF